MARVAVVMHNAYNIFNRFVAIVDVYEIFINLLIFTANIIS